MKIILDACCAINLHNGGALEVVLSLLPGNTWLLGSRVLDECHADCGLALELLLRKGAVAFADDRSLTATFFLSLLAKYDLDEGETECIAHAFLDGGLVIATDDRRARTIIKDAFGPSRLTGSLGLLRLCVVASRLSADDAYAYYRAMVATGGFLPKVQPAFFVV